MSEILDHNSEDHHSSIKTRHGCVTAWLIFMLVANGFSALYNLIFSDIAAQSLPTGVSTTIIFAIGLLGIANVVFAAMLLQWKILGFYGFAASAVIGLVINYSIGIELSYCLLGLTGIAILFGILQIKGDDNISAWDHLEE